MKKLGFAVCAAVLASSGVAQAATQCFGDAGTFGAVSVTFSAGCGTRNFTYGATTNAFQISGANVCTLTFSKPLATSSFTVDIGNVDTPEVTSISTNFGAYSVQAADLSASTAFPDVGTVSASGGNIVNTGGTQAKGRFQFISAPPASVTSLTLNHPTVGWTSIYRVCADDAGAAPPASVPTMTEWAMILFGTILAGGAALHIQRRRQFI